MNRETEDRLRAALHARADQVTQQTLRPAAPPSKESRPRWRIQGRKERTARTWVWAGAAAGVAAAVAAVVVGVAVNDDNATQPAQPAPTTVEPSPTNVTGSDCPRERALITTALETSGTRGDVDGDGQLDTIAVAVDDQAGAVCRAFVGVRTATGTYSTALDGMTTVPEGQAAEVVALPDLGADGDVEIVVDTHARVDGVLAQLFTFTRDGVEWVPSPAFEDGTFYVEGGGVTEPRAADCTAEGELVLSMALAVDQGRNYEVTRHVYTATGDPLQLGGPTMESTTVPADSLAEQFPEFGAGHFEACS